MRVKLGVPGASRPGGGSEAKVDREEAEGRGGTCRVGADVPSAGTSSTHPTPEELLWPIWPPLPALPMGACPPPSLRGPPGCTGRLAASGCWPPWSLPGWAPQILLHVSSTLRRAVSPPRLSHPPKSCLLLVSLESYPV